jgi:hypothetical protein
MSKDSSKEFISSLVESLLRENLEEFTNVLNSFGYKSSDSGNDHFGSTHTRTDAGGTHTVRLNYRSGTDVTGWNYNPPSGSPSRSQNPMSKFTGSGSSSKELSDHLYRAHMQSGSE